MSMVKIAAMTGLSMKKIQLVLGGAKYKNMNLVSDEETAKILHAAADIGYEYTRGWQSGRKRKKVTAAMVAEEAGVSVRTVYEAFSTTKIAGITKETRDHVRKIAHLIGYKPTLNSQIKNFYKRKA